MEIIDFILGVLITNALAHLIIGLTKTHFLGLFGYSPTGNIAYAILQFTAAIVLTLVNYEFEVIAKNGLLIGAFSVLIIYLLLGKFLIKLFGKSAKKTEN